VESLRFVSATRPARLIRERKISAREVVEAFIAHIERVNPTLNAVVATRFEEARREADHADQRVRGSGVDYLPPLLGVPCTIKEALAVVGMPNASGLLSRKHLVSTFDATSVKRLRAAGAIPLGVTNTSELCMWMESDNRVYGRTNNPYDPTRIVGGSSARKAPARRLRHSRRRDDRGRRRARRGSGCCRIEPAPAAAVERQHDFLPALRYVRSSTFGVSIDLVDVELAVGYGVVSLRTWGGHRRAFREACDQRRSPSP
jgi:hypothetical protein